MKIVRATLEKRSICACGYDLVREEVPTGKEYIVDWDSQHPGTLICGGCKKETTITLVHDFREDSNGGLYKYSEFPLEALMVKLEYIHVN